MINETAFLVSSVICSKLSQSKVDSFGCNIKQTEPLFDMVHNSFPNLSHYEKVIDYLPLILGAFVFILAVTKHPELKLDKLFRTVALVIFLRSLTTVVTVLPSPICGMKKVEAIGGCHDCIFSGHTSMTLIFSYFIYLCIPDLKELLIGYSILTSFFIIVTRSHYTIDVIVAWIVVYAIIKSVVGENMLK